MKKIKVFFTVLALSVCALASAQNINVKGVVTDASTGDPVPFASLQIKGTMSGANTDVDGNYSISVPSQGTIVFSSVGYATQEIQVAGRGVINVALEADTVLEDVIVVAYGTATKASFTGSAAVVKSESIESHVSTSVTGALAGTTPGVQIISSTGDVASGGTEASGIRIRGIGSMSANSKPLVILDGMPYDGSISDINPQDVESMSVLKDAAASAIYGARGANGVILITTKRAGTRDAIVKFDARLGSNSRLIPMYDVIDDPALYYETHYRQMYNTKIYAGATQAEAYAYADANLFNENNGGLGYQVYTVPDGEKLIGNNFKINPKATLGYSDGEYYYIPDDWYNETFHNSFRQEYSLSVSGSGDRFTYYASAGYLDNSGVVNNNDYKRYTARVNAEYQAKAWLKLVTNMSYSHSQSQSNASASLDDWGSSGNLFYVANNMGPIYPLYVRKLDDAGNPYIVEANGYTLYDSNNTNFKRPSVVGNAVRDNEIDRNTNYADVLNGKWGVNITPVRGLTLSANVGLTNDNTRYNALYSAFSSSSNVDGAAYVTHSRFFGVTNQYLATYKTDFGGSLHNLDVLAGYEQYKYIRQFLSGYNDHLFNPYVGELNNADGKKSISTASYTSSYMIMGILSRVQYDYAGKYFASASYRRDASSHFAKGHRWGNFGSASLAWLISNEGFMSNADWVDMLKIKASYGVQGNDSIGDYPYADQYTHSYNEETGEYSLKLTYKGNEDITWESNHSVNVGVDFELFHGYLNGSLEFFDRITTDLLYSKSVPTSSGNPTGRMPVNVGSIGNLGLELTLDGAIINTKHVQWDWNLNLSGYRNKILSLDESVAETGIKNNSSIYKVGGSLYEAYLYKFAGVNKMTGVSQWYYETENGTEITENFDKASKYDCGSILPKLYGGLGTTLKAYGVDFGFQLSFQLGGRFYDGSYQELMHTNGSQGTGMAWHVDALKAWSPENPDSNIPRLENNDTVGQSACDNYLISSNFLNINNVTLGYTFPAKWTQKVKINALRFYVAGENLAVLTARKGVDPRTSFGIGTFTSGSGAGTSTYAALRTISGGVTLTF